METNSCQLAIATDAEAIHPLCGWPTLKSPLNEESKKFVIECSRDWLSYVDVQFPYVILKFLVQLLGKNWLRSELAQERKEDVFALGWLNNCSINSKAVVHSDTICQQQVGHPL